MVLMYMVIVLLLFSFLYYKMVSKRIDEEAKAQVEEKNLLYSNIIHDVKTPMTSILGFARALKDKKVPDE